MKRLYMFFCVLSLALFATAAWGSDTGKISGVITDSKSGDPIPSVNVQVLGTAMGASSNVNGEFFVLNVPTGTYDLKVTSVGYETQTIKGVEILADHTHELTIKLSETVIQGQEVTVEAQRDVIKRDVTATTKAVTAKEIESLPITTYQQALARTAGAVGSGTNIHIRGGRADEVLYLIDGMPVKDPQFQRRSLSVSTEAIGEMQVLTAGFNAEYGEAQSAVVNLVVAEGDPEYHGQIQHVMDFKGLDHYQDYSYTTGSISGREPITSYLLPKLGVTIPGTVGIFGSGTMTGQNTNDHGVYVDTDPWYRHEMLSFLGTEFRKNDVNSNSTMKLTYKPDPTHKFNFDWNQSQAWTNPYYFRLSRRFPQDYTPQEQSLGTWALSGIQGYTSDATNFPNLYGTDDDGDGRVDEEALNWQDDDGDGLIDEDLQPYSWNANNSVPTDVTRDQQFMLTFNHTLSQKTFYTIHLSRYEAERTLSAQNKIASLYGQASEQFVDMPDANGVYNHRYDIGEPFTDSNGNGMWDYNNPANSYPFVNGFFIGGDGLSGNYQQLVPDWAHFQSATSTLKFDLSSQMTLRHFIKTGLEYNYYDVQSQDIPYPSVSDNGTGTYTDVYRYYPSSAAGYVQDKMEYKDIIVNLGLRLDWWRVGSNSINHPIAETGAANYVDYVPPSKNGLFYVSPRLGIAYSVTDRDVFHFNYGYFYQRGRQDYYFTAVNQLQTGSTPIIGNPDLKPQKTIAYELGVRHQFAEDFLFDVTTYYKDIKNWIQTASQNELYFELYGRSPQLTNAAIYYNADYASIKGFEFNITKDYASNFSGRLTYTISWATGKNSYNIGSDVTRSNYVNPPRETALAWDRRHQIVLDLGYRVPLKGETFSRQWWESGWTANVLSQALSGLPYTPTSANGTDIVGQEFSKRSPWTYTTDLNLSRAFRMANLNWRFLVEIRNLFNAKNVLGWDANNYTLDTYQNGEPGYINDQTSPNFGSNPKSGPNPDAWDIPRLVRFGLSAEF